MLLPTASPDRLRSLSLYLGNTTALPAEVALHLRMAAAADDVTAQSDLATASAKVPPGRESWVVFPLDVPIASPFVWFWIPKTAGVTWRLMDTMPGGGARLYGDAPSSRWTLRQGECYAIRIEPPLRIAAEFAPGNVINGTARMWQGKSNLWASDPLEKLPQWLALEFAQPITVNTAYLTFDTNLAPRLPGPGNARETVRDYTLSVRR